VSSLDAERFQTMQRFVEANDQAGRLHDWTGLKPFYAEDAVYWYDTGVVRTLAKGPDEICNLVLVRDQLGWMNWTYPFDGFAVNGDLAFTRWWNRGPGIRPDGSYYEVIGMSSIRFAQESPLFAEQIDLFDLGKLVQLCDEIPEELLLPIMKERQLPMMRKLVAEAIGAG
jgi:hypothetical protein